MSRSKETFGKRQREKDRLKRKQDKIEKKEVRKQHSHSGNNLEDMLAYVDENGNLTTERPSFINV